MQKRIIQSSFRGTGSTVLVNVLYGIFCNNAHVQFTMNFNWHPNSKNNVVKTHRTNFRKWIKTTPKNMETFVITSNRKGYKQICPKQQRKRLIKIPYKILITGDEYNIANNVYEILKTKIKDLPEQEKAVQNAGNRLKDMNTRYENIKHKPFRFVDKKYHIHGSHRTRKQCKAKLN